MALEQTLDLLRLQQDGDAFIGHSADTVGTGRVFGGQLLAQGIMALAANEEKHAIHSIHAYFLRPGKINQPLRYEVNVIREGLGFSTRQVNAYQMNKHLFTMMASFHKGEKGLEHSIPMPEVTPPEQLLSMQEINLRQLDQLHPRVVAIWQQEQAIELRPVQVIDTTQQYAVAQRQIWFTANGQVPDDQILQQALLAYVSDANLLATALMPYGLDGYNQGLQIASIDHAIWFHETVDCNDWLLYCIESPKLVNTRAFCRGTIFNQQGRLIASVAQEGFIRYSV